MGLLNKPLWAILGLLVLGLAVSVSSTLYFRGEARTLRADLNAAQRDLKGLHKALEEVQAEQTRRVQIDVRQSSVRGKSAKAVRAVRAEIQKETVYENDSHVIISAAQLERLRRLTEAANAGIRSASKLP